jgi:oligopeptide/dipeptide ABC transporter ATP-binding protein
MTTPLLAVSDLHTHFHTGGGWLQRATTVRAVDGVSFELAAGQTLGLVGESGCGKTTLGRSVLRLLEPTAGKISFAGHAIDELTQRQLRPLRRRMQIVFQDPFSSLNPRMTVRSLLAEPLHIHRLVANRQQLEQRLQQLLERVGLRTSVLDRYPHEFSGGQRQRLGIARALAPEPDFIVCDEPISALDVSIQAQIVNLLLDLQRELGVSYLFISHDLKVVEFVSHRVAVMYLGRIVETGPAAQLYAHRQHPYTRALMSAIAVPDPQRKKTRILLQGDVPSPLSPPTGCAFHPRCAKAQMGLCDVERPQLRELVAGSGHEVACHLPEL